MVDYFRDELNEHLTAIDNFHEVCPLDGGHRFCHISLRDLL